MSARPAIKVLDEELLTLRAKILEVAAGLDRIDRGEGSAADQPMRRRIDQAIRLLLTASSDRAEQIQLLFSREYESTWQTEMGLDKAKAR